METPENATEGKPEHNFAYDYDRETNILDYTARKGEEIIQIETLTGEKARKAARLFNDIMEIA